MQEETGLTVLDPVLCGVKQFQTKSHARYVVFFYKATQWSGTLRSSPEGEVFWTPRQALASLPLVNDFLDMVAVMESDTLSEFYYFTENGNWNLQLL